MSGPYHLSTSGSTRDPAAPEASAPFAVINEEGRFATAGATVVDCDGRVCILTVAHLHARGDVAFTYASGGISQRRAELGSWRRPRLGRLDDSLDVFVDCALVAVEHWPEPRPCLVGPFGSARVDDAVYKHGIGTGLTWGVVTESNDACWCVVGGKRHRISGHMLIRALDRGENFCAPADSGGLIRDQRGRAVGLLWGCTASGDGLATPIAAVFRALGLGSGSA
jgi:hypothetical protein